MILKFIYYYFKKYFDIANSCFCFLVIFKIQVQVLSVEYVKLLLGILRNLRVRQLYFILNSLSIYIISCFKLHKFQVIQKVN